MARPVQARLQARDEGVEALALDTDLRAILEALAADQPLAKQYSDHPLKGDWKDHRDCHVRPDLVLIYRKPDNDSLELVRLGSHSELGF